MSTASPATTQGRDGKTMGVGSPLRRVDGVLKVTGRAPYSAEPNVPGCVHARLVPATIASGKVTSIDTAAAEKVPGVLKVLTPANRPKMTTPKPADPAAGAGGLPGEARLPLADMLVHYSGQPVALVVAETLEAANYAASLVKLTYETTTPELSLDSASAKSETPKQVMGEPAQLSRGDVAKATADASLVTAGGVYTVPIETHHPIEPSATIAKWEGDQLTVWDATQFITGAQNFFAQVFSIKPQQVRVICPFVGGAFGCKGAQWPHSLITIAAAREVGRPVKLSLSRAEMSHVTGHRPALEQTVQLSATPDGKLVALQHDAVQHDSLVGAYVEPCASRTSAMMYAVPNLSAKHVVKRLNVSTPTFMRAPGEAPGMWALESALDELAVALKIDPVELRRINHADAHPNTGMPWSFKALKECYDIGAKAFGWAKRSPEPGSMKDAKGRRIGWGMATATYPGYRMPGTARVTLKLDANGVVRAEGGSATHDLGTGAYTAFTQITATELGLPVDQVTFRLGDSILPDAPVAGGSTSTASIGQAIADAAALLIPQLLKYAGDSPLKDAKPADVHFADGALVITTEPAKRVSLSALLEKANGKSVMATSKPGSGSVSDQRSGAHFDKERQKYAFQSFGCHFVEVMIDPDKAHVTVNRVVTVIDNGTVINPLTALSQVNGGVIMGIGMALTEATHLDHRWGRVLNPNLADYEVPVNADVPPIEVHFINKPDVHMNAQGARGIGEIGITGVAPAIANAVYHATGVRVRDLPLTLDKILPALTT